MQLPPRGGTWVGSTCDISILLQVFPSEWLRISRFFQDHFHRIPTKFQISLGWDPWDGPLGVGFCAGLLFQYQEIELDFHTVIFISKNFYIQSVEHTSAYISSIRHQDCSSNCQSQSEFEVCCGLGWESSPLLDVTLEQTNSHRILKK
uniref:Uncharacterized protein n=1 Tax=Vespula pensylvanica TaxID=30213 RepID=A0A834MY29_VESPE|nr:hypothetical protein H0235_018049 [Vespula pensylvanica]